MLARGDASPLVGRYTQQVKQYLLKGEQAFREGDVQTALALFERAVCVTKTDSYALFQLGTVLSQVGFNGAAMQVLMRAIDEAKEDDPWLLDAWVNLGVCFRQEAHEEDAIKAYNEALRIKPDCVAAIANLSGCYVNYGQPEKGAEIARQALALAPFNAQAGHHLGLCLLEMGDYENGFKWFQSRMRIPEFHTRPYEAPMWFGEPCETLVIHGEQGIGDEIMFASLIPLAQKRVGRVIIECTERLIPIVERSFGVKAYKDHVDLMAAEMQYDYQCGIGSLPMILGIKEQLQHSGYFVPKQARVDHWRAKFPGFRVGLSWRGGTKKTHEQYRNHPITDWIPLINPGMTWISLQYNEPEKEREMLHLAHAPVEDFDDHLALVAACELVISICNTTVHEAGALNVPCWCITPNKPAWRYGIKGDGMLFYRSVTQYRQGADEPFPGVIFRCAADLGRMAQNQRQVA